jgi:hypothetical protein
LVVLFWDQNNKGIVDALKAYVSLKKILAKLIEVTLYDIPTLLYE